MEASAPAPSETFAQAADPGQAETDARAEDARRFDLADPGAPNGISWAVAREQADLDRIRVVVAVAIPMWGGLSPRQRFGAGLVATTLLPALILGLFFQYLQVPIGVPVEWVVLLLSGGHVFLTGALYLTPGTAEIRREAKRAYYLIPGAFVVLAALGFAALSPTARVFFVAAFSLVTLWHHARQNVGVYAFLVRTYRLEPMTKFERGLLSCSFLYAVFPWLSFLDYPGKTPELVATLHQLGWLLLIVNSTLLLACVLRRGVDGSRGFQSLMLVVLGLFFSPMLLFEHPFVALWASALAHALQYFYFVYFAHRHGGVPAEDRATLRPLAGALQQPAVRTWITIGCMAGLALLAAYVDGLHPNYLHARVDGLIYGAVVGVNCVHFWVDSRIWRSRLASVRAFHQRAFAVLER